MTVVNSKRARSLVRDLLQIGAVSLRPHEPFEWSSGLVAPIYCDNRRTIAYPEVRRTIAEGFTGIVRRRTLMPATIAGVATAGIPHAAWLAERLDARMVYIRSESKGHGAGNRIEGAQIGPDDEVVVVEDLISTGKSALDAVKAVRDTGATVRAVLAIFTYTLDACTTAFQDANVPCYVLVDFPTLLEVGDRHGELSENALTVLREWRTDPFAWSVDHGGAGKK